MTDIPICIVGNLADDPTLRFTASGAPVANFRVLSTPRTFDKQTNEWKDGETLGINCSVWREQAQNASESLHRGDRVIVTGNLVSRSWDKDGEKRTVMEVQVDEVGPSLRYATAQVTKAQRGQGGQQRQQQTQPTQQPADPWNADTGAGGWGGQQPEPIPF